MSSYLDNPVCTSRHRNGFILYWKRHILSTDLITSIKERIKELDQDWKDEPNKNNNHMASMILGEIDGLKWVYEWLTGKEFEHGSN